MGLSLRVSAFRGVSPADAYAALAEFWSRHDRRAEPVPPDPEADAFELHEERAGWTLLSWTAGWEWTLRRQAQLHVSEMLGCPGIMVFVYDGDLWGYELFNRGEAVDWFVQWPEEGNTWFPGKDLSGHPESVVAALPGLNLDLADVAAYLEPRRAFEPEQSWEAEEHWDVRARPGDRFRRGDECAVLDFLSLLGVDVDLVDSHVTFAAPVWSRFRVEPPSA